MLQKEQIEQRSKELAEIRHADSVYRDIVAYEKEREDYEKRWFWELLQNAKDSVNEDEKVNVKIELSDNEVIFSHSGNSFELDDILSLIIQGSSKSNQEGKTGRFGTGFITTYLLSKEVHISGKLTKDDGYFEFLLNRNAANNEEFYQLQQQSKDEFSNSIKESSYLDQTEFQTKFIYRLNEKGIRTASFGLQNLDELVPITQLFNEQIGSVSIQQNGKTKTYSKSLIEQYEIEGSVVYKWDISIVLNNIVAKSFYAYIIKEDTYDCCVITVLNNDVETIFRLNNNYPRLYYTFPLIGTEEIGIPVIINSTKYEPRKERDGVYLKTTNDNTIDSQNKNVISSALLRSTLAYTNLFTKKEIKGIYELFNFKKSRDFKWIDHEWFTLVKNDVISKLSECNVIKYHGNDHYTNILALKIPYSNNTDDLKTLWKLLSNLKHFKIPLFDELDQWVDVAENISKLKNTDHDVYSLDFIWGSKELINYIEEINGLDKLEQELNSEVDTWINLFYSFLTNIYSSIPLDKKVLLNQNNIFRNGEGMYWDKFGDDLLIDISKFANLNYAEFLLSRIINPIHIIGVGEYTLENAVENLVNTLNGMNIKDPNLLNLLQCNARLLKWLIKNNREDYIGKLKVLKGKSDSDDESFEYDNFPKSEHLILSPKIFFEKEYPLYSKLIRDKDYLNNLYNEYLTPEDYKYLDSKGFIHSSPYVIKFEKPSIKILKLLIENEDDINLLRDSNGKVKYNNEITYSDFAYLTTSDGHIYDRNASQKSSYERFKFLLLEAVEKDEFFENDIQEIIIEGLDKPLKLRKCLWVYRAKELNWVKVKTEDEKAKSEYIEETPSSKNLAELIKNDTEIVKAISGKKQQAFLNRIGVGVSDLIRNTLASEDLRLRWDKVITSIITSDADPDLVEEIFSDPKIKMEYEKRIRDRNIISRNQNIGKLIEELFEQRIKQLKEAGFLINIERKPFGSDYIITDDSSDLVNNNNEREGFEINNWFIELKATSGVYAAMTPKQAKQSVEFKDNYALIIVPLDGSIPDVGYIKKNAKVITNIGYRIEKIINEYDEIELKKSSLNIGKEGVSVKIEDQDIRFIVNSEIWESIQLNIENFIATNFTLNE